MGILKYISFVIPPLIAILIYFYLRYKFTKWPYSLLFKSFLWGMASILLVLAVQILASYMELDNLSNIRRVLFYALVIMAFFSELAKFTILKGLVYPKEDFKSPVDGIIFAVMISMGFATLNNILYFINIPNLSVSGANAITAGPANVIFGVIMGFFVGLGKLRRIRFIDSMTGLAAAVFFHALYDFCLLTKDYRLLMAFFIGATIIGISLCIAAIRIQVEAKEEEKS
jgi:RsiW-degrading membrane proteinase PrsW (M82 family)